MGFRDSLPSNRRVQRQPPPDATKPKTPAAKPGTPPVVAYEDVTAACGHVEKFGLFEDKKDKHRDARRQKCRDRPCTACRQARQQQEQEAAARRRAAKARTNKQLLGRLPDGSRFEVVYDAGTESWSGTLTVVVHGEPTVFTGQHTGVFRLLQALDQQYRDTLTTTR
jgi:hypothetical protein